MQREAGNIYRLHGLAVAYHAHWAMPKKSKENLQALYAIPGEAERWPFGFARAHAWLGDADEAFKYLEMSGGDAQWNFGELETNAYFRPIHDDPRWQPLVDAANAAAPKVDFNPPLPREVRARL